MTDKPILRLDPTTIAKARCLREIYYSNDQGLVPLTGRPPLDFGSAIHTGVACLRTARAMELPFDEAATIDKCTQQYAAAMCFKNPPRDMDNLVAVLRDYFRTYKEDDFLACRTADDCAVEKPFSIPFHCTDTLDIMLCGKTDTFGTIENGNVRILQDTKHTSSTSINEYLDSYRYSQQMMIYSYALRAMGWTDYYPPVQIDGIFISKKYQGARCCRSQLFYYPEYMIDRTMAQVRALATRITEAHRTGQWDYNYAECMGKYGPCEFASICTTSDDFQQMAISNLFTKREYNPATF